MKKTRKVQLLATILGATAVVAGLALLNAPVQASAAETAAFAMEKGAAVRAVKDQAGIRWETTVNKAWFDDFVAELKTENKTIKEYSFGTFVTSVDNVTTEEGVIDVTKLTSTTNEVTDLDCTVTPDFKDETPFTYYSSILYTAKDLAGVELKAYATELIARSYMKYTLADGTIDYVYADSNDNQRCMRAVALAATENNPNLPEDEQLTDEQLGYIADYFSDEATAAVDFDGYYETATGETVQTYTTAYLGAKKVGEMSDGVLKIDGLKLGDNYTLTLFDASGNYAETTEFQYITRLVTDKTPLVDTNLISDGYYVLGADIMTHTNPYGSWWKSSAEFSGTLDGNGHKIYDSKFNRDTEMTGGGLFYALKDATIKNLVMENIMLSTGKCGVFASINEGTTTFENVYVSMYQDSSDRFGTNAGFVYDNTTAGAKLILKDCVVYAPAGVASDDEDFGFVSANAADNSIAVSNCTFINGNGKIATRLTFDEEGAVSKVENAKVNNTNSAVVTLTDTAALANCSAYVKLTKENFASTLPTLTNQIAVLTDDVDLGDTYLGADNTFTGAFIGQGYTVSGINATESQKGGLFKTLKGSLVNVAIKGKQQQQNGLITDQITGSAYLQNVYVETTISNTTIAAPVARYINTTTGTIEMKNVVLYSTMTDKRNGAVIGFMKSTATPTFKFENCYYITLDGADEMVKRSGDYINAKNQDCKYFWDIGDTKLDGTVMTTDDGWTGYTDYNTFYDAAYNSLNTTMQSFLPAKTAQSGE